ncbi:sensor histidine kinase [Polaribacter butkevichii]|uniref:histidine kinase n=1 Tax=Polaribacter butkevichii TaxID=218490 RepID=A0A2P6C6F6_9FLAO|nr:ATP-binding protein [Polaribacter butkevichii]PQJ68509.1 histidine kinase [Polaribacter butkevichii]
MEFKGGELIFLVSTLIIGLITIALVALFGVFQKKKKALLIDRDETKKRFEREIAETQIEIREETLRNISWELHDNIGQLLTLAKIQLQNATPENISEVSETITKGLTEVRALSKLINPEAIKNIKLGDAVQLEIDRFNRLNFINSTLIISGDEQIINKKSSIIIFRILQEFFSNTIKHSKASNLRVQLKFTDTELEVVAADDGVGFSSLENEKKGIGLENIKNRAKLIGASAVFTSEVNKGTSLKIVYKL